MPGGTADCADRLDDAARLAGGRSLGLPDPADALHVLVDGAAGTVRRL